MKIKLLVILGPTATGKSDLAVMLAKKLNGEVISADSRQVFKGLDIGTGKITAKEMCGVPHHLLDIADPSEDFSVTQYVELAEKAIEDIVSRSRLPIITGGTGFYIQALVDGIAIPDVPPDNDLRDKLSHMTLEALQAELNKLDQSRLATIDAKNPRRLIRAIEIASVLGHVPELKKAHDKYDATFIGLDLPPEELKARIKRRLMKRLDAGMIDEAKNLHERGLSWERMEELGLEYRYLAKHLQGKISREEMTEKLYMEIWHYAKRQMTWFKRDKRIKWFEPGQFDNILGWLTR